MVRAAITSRPTVGSSKIMTEGSCTSVRAMETFCFIPVESLSQRRSRKSFISSRVKIASMRRRRVAFIEPVQAAEIFDHLLRGKPSVERGGRGKKSNLRRGLFAGLWRRHIRRRWRCPPVGARIVASMRSVVVFPAPLAPRRP